jgi:hypothetical protein
MNTCKLTSSVKIAAPVEPGAEPYILDDVCVVDGLSLESKNRAWLPPWSQTMYRGIGKRSASRSWHPCQRCNVSIGQSGRTCASLAGASRSSAKFS